MITRLTSPAFSICAEVHVPAPLNVYRHRADLIQEFGRRNATFWVSWKVPARGTGWNGQKRAVRERNRRKHPPAAPVFRKIAGADAVFNLVGILTETTTQTYRAAHVEGAHRV